MRMKMLAIYGAVLVGILLGFAPAVALADGIAPGLWQITSRTESGGVTGPPRLSSKCLTPEQASDLPTTFTPVGRTINSVCAPIDRSFTGGKLSWHLVCKGQLNMELTGEFNFDSAHHYTGTVQTKAAMAGMAMIDTKDTLEAKWVSACSQ
jgi:hypothetical protein